MYSKEEGTPATKLPDQIHGNTKKQDTTKLRILFVAPFITSSVAWQIVNENMVNNIIDKDTKIFLFIVVSPFIF